MNCKGRTYPVRSLLTWDKLTNDRLEKNKEVKTAVAVHSHRRTEGQRTNQLPLRFRPRWNRTGPKEYMCDIFKSNWTFGLLQLSHAVSRPPTPPVLLTHCGRHPFRDAYIYTKIETWRKNKVCFITIVSG